MKKLTYATFDAFADSLSGPACVLIHDGDYDRAIVWPDGASCNADRYRDNQGLCHLKYNEARRLSRRAKEYIV